MPSQFYFDEGKAPVAVARESLKVSSDHFARAERGKLPTKRLHQALQKSKANAFNIGLFTDISILALLLPTLTLLIERERHSEQVGWFCDRDSMINWCDGVLWDLASENLAGMAENFRINVGELKQSVGLPDRSSGQEQMWFDHFIRSADWLAGTLAAWDWRANQLSAEQVKYKQVVEEVCADCENMIFLPISMGRQGITVSRLVVSRASPAEAPEEA